MHNAAYRVLGLDARYRAVDVAPAGLGAAVRRLRAPAVAGANVTIPHKQAVVAWLDGLTPAARDAGAVNTIVRGPGGLIGDNTDGEGLLRALAELGVDPRDVATLVLGAGGAARGVVAALLAAGAEVAVFNRTQARAEALASELSGNKGRLRRVQLEELAEAVRSTELLVQATSAGMAGAAEVASPLPRGMLPRRGVVVDLVYRPRTTALLAEAAAAGLTTQNGLPMLVHQGALAIERWFGVEAPLDVMRRAAEEALG